MKFSTILISLSCASLFLSCSSKPEGKTNAQIIIGAVTGSPDTAGGMVIYGRNQIGGQTFGINVTGDNTAIELPNGVWDFIGVTWDGASGPMTGTPRCADVEDIPLNGGDVTVTMFFNQTNCFGSVFGTGELGASTTGFPHLAPVSCGNLNVPSDYGAVFDKSSFSVRSCIPTTSMSPSYKVILPEVALGSGFREASPTGLESACVNYTLSGTFSTFTNAVLPANGNIQVPYFGNGIDAPIPTKVILFENPNCTGPSEVFNFSEGLNNPTAFGEVAGGGGQGYMVVKGDSCGGSKSSPTKYQGSEAVTAPEFNPICSAQQLANISTNMNFNKSKNFILARNIDLSLIGDFTSFMIGQGADPYGSTFAGNGYTISNLTLNTSSNTGVGLFAQLGAGALIEDLGLVGVNITSSDDSRVGALVGSMVTGASIKDVSVSSVTIDATAASPQNDIGGVIGRFDGANADFIKASDITIDVDNHGGVGGVIGYLGNATPTGSTGFKNVSVNGVDINNTGTNDISDIGGVIGFAQESGIFEVEARGVNFIMNDAFNVGGVFGRFVSTTATGARQADIQGLFASGTINITKTAGGTVNKVGGIGGSVDSGVMDSVHDSLYSTVTITTDFGGVGLLATGGIFGEFASTGDRMNSLIALINEGNITCGGHACGGLIGAGNTAGSAANFHIYAGLNYGTLSSNGDNEVGGICGHCSGNINSSVNRGALTASGGINIGGIIGRVMTGSRIHNSINDGNIGGTASQVGGFIGNAATAVAVFKSANLGSIDGSTTFSADFGTIVDTCAAIATNNYTTTTTAQCGGAGQVDYVASPTAATDFPNLRFGSAASAGGNASLAANGNLVAGTGMDFTVNVYPGEFLIISGDTEQNIIPLLRTPNAASAITFDGNGTRTIADGAAFVAGPWVYDATDILKLNLEAITDLITPNQLGSQENPILIDSVAKWNTIKGEKLLMKKAYKLTADIDFGSSTFEMIGTSLYPFTGSFNGNNHTLRNITINQPSQNDVGIFRSLGGNARIDGYDDLTDEDAVLYLEGLDITGQNRVGGLVGAANDEGRSVRVSNVVISNSNIAGNFNVGGLFGLFGSSTSNNNLSGLVNISTTITENGTGSAGGIFGRFNDTGATEVQSVVSNGDVTGTNFVGGIIGALAGTGSPTFKRIGRINSTISGTGPTGGLIGNQNVTSLTLSDAFVRGGFVTSSGTEAGGIIGMNSGSTVVSKSYVRDVDITSTADAGAFIGDTSGGSVSGNFLYSFWNTLSPDPNPAHFTAVGTFGTTATAQDVVNGEGTYVPENFFLEGKNFTIQSALGNAPFVYSFGVAPSLPGENELFTPPNYHH